MSAALRVSRDKTGRLIAYDGGRRVKVPADVRRLTADGWPLGQIAMRTDGSARACPWHLGPREAEPGESRWGRLVELAQRWIWIS